MIIPFIFSLTIAGLAGLWGPFLIWMKLSFLGDALAHGLFLGVSVGIAMGHSSTALLVIFGLMYAVILHKLWRPSGLPEGILALLSQGGLAVGIIILSQVTGGYLSLGSSIMGDVLMVNPSDGWLLCVLVIASMIVVGVLWKPFVAITIHPDIAYVEGYPLGRLRFVFLVMVSGFATVAFQLMGALLLSCLLLGPSLAVAPFITTPQAMCFASGICGMLCVASGFGLAYGFDWPVGASVALTCLAAFAISYLINYFVDFLVKKKTF